MHELFIIRCVILSSMYNKIELNHIPSIWTKIRLAEKKIAYSSFEIQPKRENGRHSGPNGSVATYRKSSMKTNRNVFVDIVNSTNGGKKKNYSKKGVTETHWYAKPDFL